MKPTTSCEMMAETTRENALCLANQRKTKLAMDSVAVGGYDSSSRLCWREAIGRKEW